MADYVVTDEELTSVANAIRTAGGTSASLSYPTGFVNAINNIPQETIHIEVDPTASELMVDRGSSTASYFSNNSYTRELLSYIRLTGDGDLTGLKKNKVLKTVVVENAEGILPSAFEDDSALEEVYILCPFVCKTYGATGWPQYVSASVKFYVPASLLSSYKAATYWSDIANQIYAIP